MEISSQKQDSLAIQAALREQAKLKRAIRSLDPPTVVSKNFLTASAPTTVTWSLPAAGGRRYVALHGIKKRAPEQHQIHLLDLHIGRCASLFAVDLEWLAWTPCHSPGSPDPPQTSDVPAAPHVLLCVRSGIFNDGGLMASLLLYQWFGTSQPTLIWRRPHGRFRYPEGKTPVQNVHLSPDHGFMLWQAPINELEVINLSEPEIGRSQRLLPVHGIGYHPVIGGSVSRPVLVGWSPCGKVVAVILSCHPESDSEMAEEGANIQESILHIWHAKSGSLLLGLNLHHDTPGGCDVQIDLQGTVSSWAPAGPGLQVARLAIVNIGWLTQASNQKRQQVLGHILEFEVCAEPSGSTQAHAVWHCLDVDLGSVAEECCVHYPQVQWSPQGNQIWITLGSKSWALSALHGQQIRTEASQCPWTWGLVPDPDCSGSDACCQGYSSVFNVNLRDSSHD